MATPGCGGSASRWCTTSQPTSIARKKTVRTRGGRTYRLRSAGPVARHRHQVRLDQGLFARRRALMPHAYNTDAAQKRLLKQQLQNMRDGGTVAMVMPNNPFRCPPGPYERACMIAHYLKTRKPKSKLVILDPKRAFSKQPVFVEAFDKYYKGIIELNLSTEIDDFSVGERRPQDQGDRDEGRQEGACRRRQHHPAAARGRDRGQGRHQRRRLVPRQSRELLCQEGAGHLCAGRRRDRGGDAQVGIFGQQPGQGGRGRHRWRRSPRRTSSSPAIAIPAGRCWLPTTT